MKLKVNAVLDPEFAPLSVAYRDFQSTLANSGVPINITIKRNSGYASSFDMNIYPDGTGHDEENFAMVERIVKALLWIHGGYEIVISGSAVMTEKITEAYSDGGIREFDRNFMSRVYERLFAVSSGSGKDPNTTDRNTESSIGRHLDGCRIGFDAGGSDRKVSAVIDGEAVYSEEVVWHPKLNSDPMYHYNGILEAFKTAAEHMPRVDAIGISTAGVCVDNRIMVGSLFLKVSDDDFEKHVKNIYKNAAAELGDIPIEVANDGDVTALAGAMELDDVNVLGVAMGTSEAGGYVDVNGNITGWLNQLAFVPVDFNSNAMLDEWSGDWGCGVKYFSQDSVIKLAPAAGIDLDESMTPAEKLKVVQDLMVGGDSRAADIYRTIGVYFGYGIAFYSLFYDIKHVLIMGRVTSGEGGVLILDKANEVLKNEFPDLAKSINLHIPDENSRRVGQSIAAASLPQIK